MRTLASILFAVLPAAHAQEAPAPAAAPAATPSPAAPAARADRPRQTLPLVEVVVYEDRALVLRAGGVPVAGGVESVLVGGLPPSLLETSLRAGLADPEQGKVISVSSEVERKTEIQDTKLRAVEEERRGVERQISDADDELARVAAREA